MPQAAARYLAESFFNVATEIEKLDAEPAPAPPIINSYGYRSLHEQSHGESFFALMMNRFGGHGLYILDEPEAALSLSAARDARESSRAGENEVAVHHCDAFADSDGLSGCGSLPDRRVGVGQKRL